MSTVHEQVQQWAEQKDAVGEHTKEVSRVLGNQEEEKGSDEQDSAKPGPRCPKASLGVHAASLPRVAL
jgi:hypothetical protein